MREVGSMLVVAMVMATFAVAVTFCGGCGRSALGHATEALGMVHIAQEETVSVIRASLQEDLQDECGELADRAARLECGQGAGERWRDAEAGVNASAETIDTLTFSLRSWARAVAAKEADEDSPPFAVCEALSRLVAMVDAWAEFGGVPLPLSPWTCPGYVPGEMPTATPDEPIAMELD